MKRTAFALVSIVYAAGLSIPAYADDDMTYSLALGFDYSTGDYGQASDTTILFVPLTGKIETGHWTFKAVVPYLDIDGPGAVVQSGDILASGSASGLGDITVSASYTFWPSQDGGPFIELTGKVKLPTADETKGLGTGETDVTIQGDIYKSIGDTTAFAGAGYRFRGDPSGTTLEDGFVGSLGLSNKFNTSLSGGLMLDYRQAATSTSDDPLELVPFVTWKAADDWSIQLYGTVGLSDSSPDSGIGMQLKRTIRSQ